MKRSVAMIVVLLTLILIMAAAVAATSRALLAQSPRIKIYTVFEVASALRQSPRTWMGRTLLVQGELGSLWLRHSAIRLHSGALAGITAVSSPRRTADDAEPDPTRSSGDGSRGPGSVL